MSILSIVLLIINLLLIVIFFLTIRKKRKSDEISKKMMINLEEERKNFKTTAHWYKSILDAIPLPITVTDPGACWTFINTRVENFLGVKLDDIKGKPCSTWGAQICNTPNCGIECAKRGVKQTYFTHNGASYKVDVEILKDINGDTAGYIEMVQDVTQFEEMSKKQMDAEALSKAKSYFLTTVSHEIRTPLNAILGIADIEMQDQSHTQKTREALIKIHSAGNLLLHLINDILDLSKIEAGKLELSNVNYNVPSLINDIVHINIVRINNKPIEFFLNLNENIPEKLFGDEIRIRQILNNILSNAFKYTERGMVTLSIDIERINDNFTLIFKISDTGQGMTHEEINNMFNEYSRFHIETNRAIEGTGIGMSITKHLIRLMNGEIYIYSKIDKGTTFTIKLPQGTVDSAIIGKETAKNLMSFHYESAPAIRNAQITRDPMPYGRVLIVDDVETNLYVAKGFLMPYKLNIDLAASGFETIDKIKNGEVYDIIFMDHMMPKMDGIETVKNMRKMGYQHPIIALTANALLGQAQIFLDNGFNDFISKPIDIRQLNNLLNKFIRDKQPAEVIEKARLENEKSKINNSSQKSINVELYEFFIRDAENAIKKLEILMKNNFSGIEDIKDYTIITHSMKSALVNIEEQELSDIAYKLEQAGKNKIIDVISSETSDFILSLRVLTDNLIKIHDISKTAEETDEDFEFLREKLLDIKEACMVYDKRSVKKAIFSLREKIWSKNVTEMLKNISEHLLHSDYEKISDIIEENIKKGA